MVPLMERTTLATLIERSGGIGAAAKLMSDITGERIDYDRVYQWQRTNRLPPWAIRPAVQWAQTVGVPLTLDDALDLTVARELPQRAREAGAL